MPIPALIAGGLALGGAIYGAVSKAKQAKKQREFLAEQQRIANEYNAPKAQMDRFKQANLNPNLIYGSGQAAAGTYAETSSEGQGGQFQPVDLSQVGGSIGTIYDLRMKKAGMDKLEEETRKTHTETNIITQKWIIDKINYAKNQNNVI